MDYRKMVDDVRWRQKFYKNIDPNQAVGISESIIAVLLFSCDTEQFPFDYSIVLSSNFSLHLYQDNNIPKATLYPFESGSENRDSPIWDWSG
jgi:hypothetical protein